jgi:hypothetical protein
MWKASSSLGMSPIPSFGLLHPLLLLILIPWLLLSVPSTSIGTARLCSSKRLPTVILTESFGWKASLKKHSIQQLDTYKKITLGKYQALHNKGAPWAISKMCVLTIKKDENLCPLCAKSQIIVLGNHKDPVWKKSKKFALILCQNSLCFQYGCCILLPSPSR